MTVWLSRRRVLAGLLGGVSGSVAGCGSRDGTVDYGDRIPVTVSNASTTNASNASAASAAAARAELEGDKYVVDLEALALREHELVVRDDYRGVVIQGTVENAGHQRVKLVEVRTRVYNSDGEQLGRRSDPLYI